TEFQVTRQRWSQDNPTLAFDGTDFVLAWRDYRFSAADVNNDSDQTLRVFFYPHPNVWGRLITTSGMLKRQEFSLKREQMVGEIFVVSTGGSSVIAANESNYD